MDPDALLRSWTARGKLEARGCDVATRRPMYRAGDVLDLARRD